MNHDIWVQAPGPVCHPIPLLGQPGSCHTILPLLSAVPADTQLCSLWCHGPGPVVGQCSAGELGVQRTPLLFTPASPSFSADPMLGLHSAKQSESSCPSSAPLQVGDKKQISRYPRGRPMTKVTVEGWRCFIEKVTFERRAGGGEGMSALRPGRRALRGQQVQSAADMRDSKFKVQLAGWEKSKESVMLESNKERIRCSQTGEGNRGRPQEAWQGPHPP